MSFELASKITFGEGGSCESRIGTGWSLGEAGYRWMIGAFSVLDMGAVDPGKGYMLAIDIEPFVKAPLLPFQRLVISIGGVPFVQAEIEVEGRYGYRIPPELIADGGDLQVVFDHPDAARPSDLSGDKDHRMLSFLVRSAALYAISGAVEGVAAEGAGGVSLEEAEGRTGLPAAELISQFESLGENCEFGLVQRRCGAEPLSLLRFSNTLLPNLFQGLDEQFKRLGNADTLGFRLEGATKKEYIIDEKVYALTYHTFRYKGEIDEDKFLASEAARLRFLARKLNEDIRDGNKIFVYRRNTPLPEEEILPLLGALNEHGRNTLFWVVPAEGRHAPGTVEWAMPGLLKGYIDRFAPNDNAHDMSLDVWTELCANAYALWQKRITTLHNK